MILDEQRTRQFMIGEQGNWYPPICIQLWKICPKIVDWVHVKNQYKLYETQCVYPDQLRGLVKNNRALPHNI